MNAPLVVLGNPAARRRRAVDDLRALVAIAEGRGNRITVVEPAGRDAVAGDVRAALASTGADRVVVVGGDGMVHQVLQAVAGTSTVMGIVPSGTGNDYARALGLPVDGTTDAAIDAALGPAVAVDALTTGERWVASIATLGFSAVVNERADAMAWPRGSMRYTIATVAELPRLRAVPVVIDVDGVEHPFEVTLMALGSTRYFGGAMDISPGADPTDGLADLTVVARCGRLELLRTFPKVFKGRHTTHRTVTMMTGREFRLRAGAGAPDTVIVRADGEALGRLPMTIRSVPGAVHVAGARP